MKIDIDKLRKKLKQECYGAAFIGGYGGALAQSHDVDKASPEELVNMAVRKGIDLSAYVDKY